MADYKLSQLTEKTSLIASDIMHIRTVGAIDQKMTGKNLAESDVLYQYLTLANILSKSANYVILNTDLNPTVLMTAGAANKTVTLPTAADNTGKKVKLIKVDDGAGYAILDGEGAETINGTPTWEVTEQWGFVEVISDGTKWIVLNQQGCIYEMWDNNDYDLTPAWIDYYNLSGIVPGQYAIEYGILINLSSGSQAWTTIATTADTEDDTKYTLLFRVAGGEAQPSVFLTKSFIRSFASNAILYLNAKEIGTAGIAHLSLLAKGYIRATRTG